MSTDTKPRFTSFAAPTEEDIALFQSLSEDEQRAIIEDEIGKGMRSETRELTPELREQIWQEALALVGKTHAQSRDQ